MSSPLSMVRVFSVCAHHILEIHQFFHYGARIFYLRAPYLCKSPIPSLWCAYFLFARTISLKFTNSFIMVRVFSVCAHHILEIHQFFHYGAHISNLRTIFQSVPISVIIKQKGVSRCPSTTNLSH